MKRPNLIEKSWIYLETALKKRKTKAFIPETEAIFLHQRYEKKLFGNAVETAVSSTLSEKKKSAMNKFIE